MSTSSLKKLEGILERLQLGDLAADVHVDAGHGDCWQFGGAGVDGASALEGNTELIFFLAGRDLGVGARIDVRIDPEGDRRLLAGAGGALVENLELGLRIRR